jgi:RNA polymerase sigma-70 factor (ECF subfamily)
MMEVMSQSLDREETGREDSELIARFLSRAGEKEAAERLVSKYWRLLVAWVQPRVSGITEAEDVVQEVFIRAFRNLDKLQDPLRFLGWILKIARNLAADRNRRHREVLSLDRIFEEGDLQGKASAEIDDPVEMIDRGDEIKTVLKAVNGLPELYREVLLLRYFQGHSGSEIAAMLDEPEGTIRNRLFRALQLVRKALKKGNPTEVSAPPEGRGR